MKIPKNFQEIKIGPDAVPCDVCGENIADLAKTKYIRKVKDFPRHKLEFFICRKCRSVFAVRYDMFDASGHLDSLVFSDTGNDAPDFFSYLSEEQRNLVAAHLISCEHCQKKRDEAVLDNALFENFLSRCRLAGGLDKILDQQE